VVAEVADLVSNADALVITAGAGMGVDSGLPDFRSPRGLWRAYPPLEALGLSFIDMAQPHWFDSEPAMAWAWYGHRQKLYRETTPHAGYEILKAWANTMPSGSFVFTSNVDGQFERAGFEPARVFACHGNIHRYQCTVPCSEDIWPAEPSELVIDLERLRALGALPRCRNCGALARPNVLMFEDFSWASNAAREEQAHYCEWLDTIAGRRIVVVECGAGTAVATVRDQGERIVQRLKATLIRINPAETDDAGPRTKVVPLGALEALSGIHEALTSRL